MIAVLSAIAALAVVAVVVLASLLGWAGRVSCIQRTSLCVMAAGLVWAGPARFLDQPPGLGDLMFVSGLAVHLAALYGRALWRKIDSLDGVLDGRIGRPGGPD